MAVDEDAVWTVQVVEFVDVPKPDPTGMSDGELFVRNTVRTVTIGGTFASFQIKGVSLSDAAAIAAKRMDDIVANREPGDAVQVVDHNGVMRFARFRWG